MPLGVGMKKKSLALAIYSVLICMLLGAQCEEPEVEQPLQYSIEVTLDEGSLTQIPSNGLSTATLVIKGKILDPASGTTSNDSGAVTVRINEGKLTGNENTQPDETFTTLVGVPQAGEMKVNFQCKIGSAEEVMIQIENKNGATAIFPVTCVQPAGSSKVVFDKSACESDLVADGISSCLVTVDLFYDLDEAALNELGFSLENGDFTEEQLRFSQSSIALNATSTVREVALGSVITGDDPSVLAATADGSELAEALDLTVTSEEGRAEFFIFSPQLGLEQTVTIQVSGTDAYGASLRADLDVMIKPFTPKSSLDVDTTRTHIIGDGESNASINFSARDLYGEAAELATINLTITSSTSDFTLVVREDSAASLTGETDSKRLILDDNGEAVLILTGGIMEAGEVISEEVILAASFDPGQGFEVLQQTISVTISPPGSLIMNVTTTPDVIQADEQTSVVLAAEVSIGSSPQVSHPVNFSIPISDQSKIFFGTPNSPDAEAAETLIYTNENGVASVNISAAATDIRALTTVYVETTLDGQELKETIRIDVQRAPFLQSIVFQSASPTNLGISGSSRPTSSVVSFMLLDDLSASMADVPVDFRVNDTAGAGVSVTSRSLSDSGGIVNAVLSAGTQSGPVTVVATADPDGLYGGPVTVESAPIAITGGIPNFANSYFLCDAASSIYEGSHSVACTVTLADRFTDISTGTNLVQFRAEGGNITPAATGTSSASAAFTTGEPGPSVASIYSFEGDSWSYGALIPSREVVEDATPRLYDNGTLTGGENGQALNFFEYCFDGSSYTPCDLISLCATDQNQYYCPLAPDVVDPSQGCWELLLETWDHIQGGETLFAHGALSALILASDDPTINTIAPQQDPYCPGKYISGEAYYNPLCGRHNIVKQAVDSYLEVYRTCGAPIACLTGLQDIDFIDGDECNLAYGCFDFTAATPCPQDGLITLLASFRGEEAFVDLNGNGLFDFVDENDNQKHDQYEDDHEPFIDMPEPFLDKNNNCGFDVFSGQSGGFQTAERMAPYDLVRHSDQFLDEDGSGDYGYSFDESETIRSQGNGQYDRDKEIFMQTYLLELTSGYEIIIGEPCGASNVGKMVNCALGDDRESYCRETEPLYQRTDLFYDGIADDCTIPESEEGLDNGSEFQLSFNLQDFNGNCFSPGFSSALTVTTEGPITINGELTGTETTTLDDNYCGFYGSIGHWRNRHRPWCEYTTDIGARNIVHNFVLDCQEGDEGRTYFAIEAAASTALGSESVKEYGYVYCPYCGDGKVADGEDCDDGNDDNGDGCNSECVIECGWRCENDVLNPGGAQICSVASGTDYITAGYESCDDGNVIDGDGCSSSQQQEPGYDCTYTEWTGPGCSIPGQKSTCVAIESASGGE